MKRIALGLPVALAAFALSAAAQADDLLGFYVGAGVGISTVRSDDAAYGLPAHYNDHETAWKGIVGIRPISILGAEAEYIDFGHPSQSFDPNNINANGFDSHPRAGVLFGVGYFTLIPLIDIYAKAGVARLETDVTSTQAQNCAPGESCPPVYSRHNETNNRFAYGVGVQSKMWGFALRAEYERIDSQYGDPDALTVSATYTF